MIVIGGLAGDLAGRGLSTGKAIERACPAQPAGWLRNPYSRNKLKAALYQFFGNSAPRIACA
jgi:hypothetical protein